jgi:FkbH-like protein
MGDLRRQIDAAIAQEHWQQAAGQLRALWEREGDASQAAYIVSAFGRMRDHLQLTPHRLAILRSFTVEPIIPLLRAGAFATGIDLAVHPGDFNAYASELLDEESSLYRFQPDTIILAVQTRDLAPEQFAAQVEGWIGALRARTAANFVIHSLEQPSLGIYESQCEENHTIGQVNQSLRRLARQHQGVYILDYDALVARHGREHWGDERKWLTARLPIAAANLGHMAREWLRFLAPLTGKVAKAIAVDLDNTLWGGIIGEDGMAGIQIGSEYPGAAYQALQRTLLDLSQRGILLAVCSKNNSQDAMEVLNDHPGMLLRPEHFTAMRINWNDKAQNLRKIAAELNIGLDAIAFLDDNPVERQQVRDEAPEVMVVELPSAPMDFARAVRDYPAFERLTLSGEDRERTRYYAAERQRGALEQSVATREDFLQSLEQEAGIAPVNEFTLARVAQLTQKTNQFNLTTRRYTDQQIAELAKCPGWRVLSIRVRDRFADNGLVGVAILHRDGEICEIDSFLLSCRVIGRSIETALLAHLAEEARARGARRLEGWFLPTRKNAPARDFYRQHGFQLLSETPAGQLWSLDLETAELRSPEWVRMRYEPELAR